MKKKCIYLLILIGLFFFMMSLFSCVKAKVFKFEFNDPVDFNKISLNFGDIEQTYEYVTLVRNSSNQYTLYISNSKCLIDSYGSYYCIHPVGIGNFDYYIYNVSMNKIVVSKKGEHVSEIHHPASVQYRTLSQLKQGFEESYIFRNYNVSYQNLFFGANILSNPFIVNKEDISSGKFDKVVINAQDYNHRDFYLFSYYYSDNTIESIYPRKIIHLNAAEIDYFVGSNETGNYMYEIPLSATGIDLVEGNKYGFKLAAKNSDGNYEYLDNISFTIGVVTPEEKEQADRDKQLGLQEEQNKTSKGIWDTLKQLLDFINPFSENFFVYKLVELLIEGLKGLFVPSNDFFENWINSMNDWLSDRLGALYYPVDLVVDFLNRISEISDNGSAVISWNEFNFMGATLIQSGSYDLNSLLSNQAIKNIHDIYLVVVDVILYIFLIVLAKNTFVDIFGR